jgi:tRNA(Leu) C34 or U34 (ribose-2'-O)-methylase TrmL
MTVKVAGVWELGWNTPILEIDLWEYPLRDFGVDKFFMMPISGVQSDVVIERQTMEEILAENQDLVHVFVDERGTQTLEDFVHPENALYVFGRVSLSVLPLAREQDVSLKIRTPRQIATMWPHQVAGIVLYDRFMKQQNSKVDE